jgi:hypothetical protein
VAVDSNRNRILKLLAKDPKYRRKFGTVGPTASIKKQLGSTKYLDTQRMEAILLKKRKKLLKNEKNKPNQILDKVFDFADQYQQDPMALSASLLVVAKTIYLDILGPEQTSEMFYAFAQDLENHKYEKATIH